MHLGYDRNPSGTLVSRHRCDACGQEVTVCPAQDTDEPCGYPPNYDPDDARGCPSYDERRDVAKLIAGGAETTLRKTVGGQA